MLKSYLSDVIDAIVSSVEQCPAVMRVAFKQLHKRVAEQFPEAENEVSPSKDVIRPQGSSSKEIIRPSGNHSKRVLGHLDRVRY